MENDGGSRRSASCSPNRPPSICVSSVETAEWASEEPMSPVGRIMEDMGLYIVVVMGLSSPLNLPIFRAGIETELLTRFPRFCCIQVMDGKPRWVRTTVNVDDHIIAPVLDPSVVASDPEKAVEDYVASLSTLPMDMCRPLWEFHFLDFPTSKEVTFTAVLRLHHAIGDGMSVMTLLMASSRSTADPARLPAMPPPPKRTGAIYQRGPRPPLSSLGDYMAWVWSYLVLLWHTLVDVVLLVGMVLFSRDPRTMFARARNGEPRRRKRFVHHSLNLDDVKLIKTVMNCTINDVLVGVTSAALSQYYFRKSGDTNTKKLCLRSFIPVNIRPVSTRQTYVTKVETGNRVSILICPFRIALHDDPLEYVRKVQRFMHRKKSSLEVMFTELVGDFLVKYFGVKIGSFLVRRFLTSTTVILSNVVGPAEHITLCGHPVAFIALGVYGQPQALTVHYLNYGSTIKVILSVDDAQFPDCHQLLDDFTKSIKIIKNAAGLKALTTSMKIE